MIRLDRLFRSVKNYYEFEQLLDEHQVAWLCTQESYETVTSTGRLKVNLMLSVAQNEAEKASERIKFVFDSKRERGELTSGSIPLGFRKENKKLVIDEQTAPIIRDVFRIYIEQRSATEAQRALRAAGYDYTNKAVYNILRNRKYADNGLVDAATWKRAQELNESRSCRYAPVNTFLFTGLIECPSCGRRLTANKRRDRNQTYYRCHEAQFGRCDWHGFAREDRLEQYLLDNLQGELSRQVNAEMKPKKKKVALDPNRIKAKMSKLKDLYLNDLIQKDEYEKSYRELEGQLESIEAVKASNLPTAAFVGEGMKLYEGLDRTHRKAFWSRIIRNIKPAGEEYEITFMSI